MKTREEVLTLFRAKYDYLKSVYPEVGPFEEIRLYQNPDGGWQMNSENCAAITLRPSDEEAHETHGAICAQWYQQGRAFDDAGIPGWLGYPIQDVQELRKHVHKDEHESWELGIPPQRGYSFFISSQLSEFEFGCVQWNDMNECYSKLKELFPNEPHDYEWAMRHEGEIETWLKETGEQHVPPDIANAFEIFLAQCNVRVTERFPCVCNLDNQRPVWVFCANVEGCENFSIRIWREGPPGREGANICAAIGLTPKSVSTPDTPPVSFLPSSLCARSAGIEMKHVEFVVPNLFKTQCLSSISSFQ